MLFPAKLGKRHIIYVPANVCERLGLVAGDQVDVDIRSVPKTDKERIENHWSGK